MKKIDLRNVKVKIAIVVACLLLILIGFIIWACPGEQPQKSTDVKKRSRPGSVYAPSATPVQLAERPDLSALKKSQTEETNDEENEEELEQLDISEEEYIEEPIEVIPPIPDNDPALLAMAPEVEFSSTVWSTLELADTDIIEEGTLFLGSEKAFERAYGAVLLYEAGVLDEEILDSVMADSDAIVPLALYDWVRDFGTDEDIERISDAISTCEFTKDELYSYINDSASSFGGGRSALDLWLSSFDVGEIPVDQLANIVTSPSASYDVKSQALFKLLEPETKKTGVESIEKMSSSLKSDSGELLHQTVDKWRELAQVANSDGDVEKIWDSESAVVLYLAESERGLAARDIANYLEYALRRDDPICDPVIELGTWEFANEFLESMLPERNNLSPVEIDALDRIAVSLDRLVNYDPAFNPFEEVGEDEVIPEEFFEEIEEGEEFEEVEEDEELLEESDENIKDTEYIEDGEYIGDEEYVGEEYVDEEYVEEEGVGDAGDGEE